MCKHKSATMNNTYWLSIHNLFRLFMFDSTSSKLDESEFIVTYKLGAVALTTRWFPTELSRDLRLPCGPWTHSPCVCKHGRIEIELVLLVLVETQTDDPNLATNGQPMVICWSNIEATKNQPESAKCASIIYYRVTTTRAITSCSIISFPLHVPRMTMIISKLRLLKFIIVLLVKWQCVQYPSWHS